MHACYWKHTFLSCRPCEMFCESMKAVTRWWAGPASPQCGRRENIFSPRILRQGEKHTRIEYKHLYHSRFYMHVIHVAVVGRMKHHVEYFISITLLHCNTELRWIHTHCDEYLTCLHTVQAPPLTEVVHYSASNVVMYPKYAMK